MATEDLSAELVRLLLDYDLDTGVFRWKVRVAKRVRVGDVAGIDGVRERRISILGRQHLAHRVAWLYVYGEWPKQVIDHINRNPFDNRIANLRDVSQRENVLNSSLSRANKSGTTGVRWIDGRKRWRAEIMINRKAINLGYFAAKADAEQARRVAEAERVSMAARNKGV
jgi:hypothetical protein